MIFRHALNFLLILSVLIISACGGGGSTSTSAAQTTTATLKLSTSGTLATGTALGGIRVAVILPAEVTLKTDIGGALANGVITVSGVAAPGSVTPPVYTQASGTTPAKVVFIMSGNAAAGFGIGEFVTITCDIAKGVNLKATDLTLADFDPRDLNGAVVNGLTPGVTVTIQ